MPNRRGRMVLAAAVGCWLGLAWAPAASLATVAAAGTLLPLIAIVQARAARAHGVRLQRSIAPARLFPGGSLRVRLRASNPGRRRSPHLLLEDRAPAALGGPVRLSVPRLAPGAAVEVEGERRPSVRGRWIVGPAEAVITDPFGLAEVRTTVAGRRPVVVLPAIEPLGGGAPRRVTGRMGAGSAAGRKGTGDEFHAVRPWQDGDDPRRIHWRSTARVGELMIRENEAPIFPHATVLLDTRGSDRGGREALEWSIGAAASILWHLSAREYALRLATPDVEPGPAGAGRQAAESLLEALAMARPSRAASLVPLYRRLASESLGGSLVAIVRPPGAPEHEPLARLRRAFSWCGAIVLDPGDGATGRRAAEGLRRAGWRAVAAGPSDRYSETWTSLLALEPSRRTSASPRSS